MRKIMHLRMSDARTFRPGPASKEGRGRGEQTCRLPPPVSLPSRVALRPDPPPPPGRGEKGQLNRTSEKSLFFNHLFCHSAHSATLLWRWFGMSCMQVPRPIFFSQEVVVIFGISNVE
jgi:hypothetical protein